jgi:hypothetical protein
MEVFMVYQQFPEYFCHLTSVARDSGVANHCINKYHIYPDAIQGSYSNLPSGKQIGISTHGRNEIIH